MYSDILQKENKTGYEDKLRKCNLTGKKTEDKKNLQVILESRKHSNLIMITSSYIKLLIYQALF